MQIKNRSFLKSALIFFLLLALTTTSIGIYLWRSGWIETWLERRAVALFIEKLKPSLPFEIETLDLNLRWKDLLKGNLGEVHLVLWMNPVRVDLQGPLQLDRDDESSEFRIHFSPMMTLEMKKSKSSPIASEFWARVPISFAEPTEVGALFALENWNWKAIDSEVKKGQLAVNWGSKILRATFHAHEIQWKKDEEHLALLTQPELDLEVEGESPVRIDFRSKKFEALFGEKYWELPLAETPLRASVDLNQKEIHANVGPIQVETRLIQKDPPLLHSQIHLKIENLKKESEKWFKVFSAHLPEDWEILTGKIHANADFDWNPKQNWDLAHWKTSGELQNVTFASKKAATLIGGLQFAWNWKADQAGAIRIEIPKILFKHWVGKWTATEFGFKKSAIGQYYGKTTGPFPLEIQGIPLQWSPLAYSVRAQIEPKFKLDYQLQLGLEIPRSDFKSVAQGLCLPLPQIPPAEFKIALPDMLIRPDEMTFEGRGQIDFFGGTIQIDDLALFDLLSDVPEIQFQMLWKDIRLDEFGKWSGFGRMDGTLEGYWKDVVFQYWLPTEYDFHAEVKPFHDESKIIFSPEAMKNFVKLFAGDELDDSLPGIAEWLAFGWPSTIFGGYDVYFVGLNAYSKEGSIVLTTPEPKDVPGVCKKAGKHFILCGPRFKIPIQSSRYPVVLDAPSMANLVRQMSNQFGQIQKKEKKETPSDVQLKECFPKDPYFSHAN